MQSQTRQVFARQPGHILLVDYQPPFDADISEYLYQSLKDLFALVCNITGPCRTPLFGLFALGSYPESLFQLQYVKNNFPRLHSALEELKFFTKDSKHLPNNKTAEILQQGLQDAVTQFKRHSQSLRQISTSSGQLEICVLTCRKASHLTRTIDEMSSSLELGNIKKIQIVAVEMNDGGEEEKQNENHSRDQGVSPSSSSETGIQGCGIVDTITLRKDPISFENFLKTWLLDCGTDNEHIRIELPSPLSLDYQEGHKEPEMLVLKCDVHERLINPAHLPFRSQFQINTETLNTSKVVSNKSSQSVVSYPVHTMTIDRLVKREGICESVIFGMPYIVRSTVCWKLDWEELERNQQHFTALCNVLQERDLAALMKIKSGSVSTHGLPVGYYILLPSSGSTMLLKSIAANELLLPADFNQPVDEPSTETTEVIAASLDLLQVNDSYNPVFVKSGLYSSLADLSLKGVKAPVKRGFQAPQKYQQEMHKTVNTSRPQLSKPNRSLKRSVFGKESTNKTTKRSRAALNIYISSPPDLADPDL